MKSILLHIDHDAAMSARLQVALEVARATNGHITCLEAVSYEAFATGDVYGSAMAAAIPVIRENAEKLRAEIEVELAHECVPWDWRFEYGMAAERLIGAAPLADIVLVGPAEPGMSGRGPSSLVGDVVLKSPVPVLVVPGDLQGFDVSAPMLVAWNGSAESAHALRAALPLLACSCAVTLASVTGGDPGEDFLVPLTEGARYLSRHGVACEMVELPRGHAPVADTLLAAARARSCSVLVMGAYGRPRFAELLLGGVTRRMLSAPPLPVLLAH